MSDSSSNAPPSREWGREEEEEEVEAPEARRGGRREGKGKGAAPWPWRVVCWVGAMDGLLQLARNGGKTGIHVYI